MHEQVAFHRTVDVLGLTDVAADETVTDDAGDRNETEQSVQDAVSAGSFRHLACRVARSEVGNRANLTLLETAKQGVCKLSLSRRGCIWLRRGCPGTTL